MAMRIPWTEEESLLLTDACFCVNQGLYDSRDVPTLVSYLLRAKAKWNGLEIDDVYRNEAGIALQMMRTQSIISGGPYVSKYLNASVNLRIGDPQRFNELLIKSGGGLDVRIPWSREESTLLIEGYFAIQKNPQSAKSVVWEISQATRKLAHIQGIAVDEKYRTPDGIAMCIGRMEYIATNGKHGIKNNNEIYRQLYDLYIHDPNQFNALLDQVKSRLGAKKMESTSENYKEAFFTWLNGQISDNKIRMMRINSAELENDPIVKTACKPHSFYEVQSLKALLQVRQAVESNKLFRFNHKRNLSLLSEMMKLYYRFRKEISESRPAVVSQTTPSVMEKPVSEEKSEISEEPIVQKETVETKEFTTKEEPREVVTDPSSMRKRFIAWMERSGFALPTIRSYSSAVAEAGRLAISLNLAKREVYSMFKPEEVSFLLKSLRSNPEFADKNASQHNRFLAGIRRYIEFLAPEQLLIDIEPGKPTAETDPKWSKVLAEGFPDGYQLDDFICQLQATAKWEELFGEPCPLEGSDMDVAITACGTIKDGRVFVTDEKEYQLIAEICDVIRSILSTYATVFIECIYERYRASLAEKGIYTAEVMAAQVLAQASGDFVQKWNYFLNPKKILPVIDDCKLVLRKHGGAMSVQEVAKELWFIPYKTVYQSLTAAEDCINVGAGTWMLAEHFPFSEDDAQRVSSILDDAFTQQEYMLNAELLSRLANDSPDISENLSGLDTMAVFNLLRYKLGDRFSFTKAIVAPKGHELSIATLFEEFASNHESFSLDELSAFASDIGVFIYWENVYTGAVRVSADQFVARGAMHFDVDAIDKVLEELCTGNYLPIKAVQQSMLMHLPQCGFAWDNYLLYSYVYGFSKKFQLIYNSMAKTGCYGAIVRRSASHIDSYKALVECVLMDNDQWSTASDALKLLVDKGYQASQRFQGIDNIVAQVKINKNKE